MLDEGWRSMAMFGMDVLKVTQHVPCMFNRATAFNGDTKWMSLKSACRRSLMQQRSIKIFPVDVSKVIDMGAMFWS
jgi:hypothetical protein